LEPSQQEILRKAYKNLTSSSSSSNSEISMEANQ
jgi:hypothetical protein